MTTQKKNLADYGEAMGFDVPAGATEAHTVEGELMPDFDETQQSGFDIPEHSNDVLPVHKRSLPKVLLAIMAVTVIFGLPAYLFLSAASGGGGATNTVKVDGKDKNVALKDPQADEINRLKTDLAVGKQLASTTPTPSPSPSNTPVADDKTTNVKPSPPPTTNPAPVVPTAPVTPVVPKTNPPVAANPRPVVPVVQPKPSPVVPTAPITPVVAKVMPKAIPATNPPAIPIASKPSPKPVEPAPKAVVQPKPTPPVAKAPAKPIEPVAVKPEPKPVAPIPKVIAKPEPKPVTPPVIVASNPKSVAAPMSWEQASTAGVYGGESVMPQPVGGVGNAPGTKDAGKDGKQRSSYQGAMSPTLLLAPGTNVKGHTVAPYTVSISKNQSDGVPLSIALDEPIELDKGYRLPVGTTVNFIASVRDNGSVVAISKNADIGGVEIQLPEGAISLASENNGLLMTREVSTGEGDLARADISSSLWGGAAGAGKAILQAGSQITTNNGLLGTTTTQINNGSPNIIGGALEGAFTPLASNGQKRAQQKAEQIQQRSRLNTIDVNTKVKLFVNTPIQVQIPVSGQQTVEQTVEDEESIPAPQLLTNSSIPAPASEEVPPPQIPAPPQSPLPAPSLNPPKTQTTKTW
jgi:hypothetical protein